MRHPATRALVLQAIEELARTSLASTELLDVDEVSNPISIKVGFRRQEDGGRSSMRAYKQVARAKLDLNKTQLFLVVAKGYMKVEG